MKQTMLLKLAPTQEPHQALLETMHAFNAAATHVAEMAFREKTANKFELQKLAGKLGEYSDANTGLRSPCPNIHPKNVCMNIRIHFGDGFSGSSEESCFFGSFAFLRFGFGFFCSSPYSCFFFS